MRKRYRVLYSSYGAAELKRVYQRNQLIGSLSTLGLVGFLLLIYIAWPQPAATTITGNEGPDTTTVEIEQDVSLGGYRVTREHRPRQEAAPSEVAASYVAVADSLWIDDFPGIEPPAFESPSFGDDIATGLVPGGPISGERGDGGGDGRVYTPSDTEFVPLEVEPEMIRECTPKYPRQAKAAGIEGSLWVRVLLDIDGAVLRAEIAKSSGVQAFDEAAVVAARCCVFSPGIQNKRPVRCWITYKVEFVLGR